MNVIARGNGFGRTGLLAAGAALALLLLIALMPATRNALSGLFREADPQADNYEWLSRTMAECEEQAVTQPEILSFLVVPLEATEKYGDVLKAKAMSESGGTTLFGSQDALQGLREGMLRVSSRSYVLHTRDTSNNMTHRWASATGVARLSSSDIPSDGPFAVRLQVSPEDPRPEWSSITAQGRGTCHWAFALIHQ